MSKTVKRILSVVTALLMIFSAIPFGCLSGIDWFGVEATAASFKQGDIIQLGSYPQSQVTDVIFKAALGEASFGITEGEFEYNGERYYRYKENKDTTLYFKIEPIYWSVLSAGYDGVYLLSKKIIDRKPYHNQAEKEGLTWENSSLRSWLNNEFYETAFSESEKASIRTSSLTNDNYYTGPDTKDKIFVPSYYDMNSAYGISTNNSRVAELTDYAWAMYGNSSCRWWLRTRHRDTYGARPEYAYVIDSDGSILREYINGAVGYRYGLDVSSILGVRPALKLDLNSLMVTSSGDYTVKFVDSSTGAILSGVSLKDGDITYTSGKDGTVKFSNLNLLASKTLVAEKTGYVKTNVEVSTLSTTNVNTIKLDSTKTADPLGFTKLLQNIQLGTTKIKGPTADVFGYEMCLFDFDIGVNLDFTAFNAKCDYDEKNQTYKVILGVKETGNKWTKSQFDDYYTQVKTMADSSSIENIKKSYSKLSNILEFKPSKIGVDTNLSIAGYFTFDVSDGKLVMDKAHLIENGLSLGAAVSVSQDIPFWYVCYANFKIGGEFNATGKFDLQNAGSFTSTMAFNLSAGVGVGACFIDKSIASVEVGITGKIGPQISFPVKSMKESVKVTASLDGYAKANLFLMSGTYPVHIANSEIYPQMKAEWIFSNGSKKSASMLRSASDELLDYGEMELISRDYLDYSSFASPRLLKASQTSNLTKNAVYPDGNPSLVKYGESIIAIWVDDNGTKSDANATTLMYSVYNGTSWSPVAPIYENGTPDFNAKVYSDGENVYAVWLRGSETFGDNVTVEEYAYNSELVISKYIDGSWSVPVAIENMNGVATDYAVTVDSNGIATIAYVVNDNYDPLGKTGTNSIYINSFDDNCWSGSEEIATNVFKISSLSIGKVSGNISAIYCANNKVYVNDTVIASGDENETLHSSNYQNGAVYYISNSTLKKYTPGTGSVIVTNVTSNNYKFVSNGEKTALITTINDGYTNEIYVSYEGDNYQPFVALTCYGKYISSYDLVMNDDGTFTVASDIRNLSNDENDVYPYTTTDFIVENIGDYVSVAVGEIVNFDDSKITPDGTVTFNADVANIGTSDISRLNISLANEEGTILKSYSVDKEIKSGESEVVSVDYKLPSNISRTTLKMIVTAPGDIDDSDNVSTIEYGLADVVVENYAITDDGLIIARVVNQGFENANNISFAISKFDEGEDEIANLDIGNLKPGERKSITYSVPEKNIVFTEENQRNLFLLSAETNTEETNTGNNDAMVSIYPTGVEEVDINQTELNLAVGDAYQLFAEVKPLTAFDKSISWMTNDTSVATVDDNGNVVAIGEGTAIITAITSNKDIVANCNINVTESVEKIEVTGIDLDTTNVSMLVDETKSIVATVSPENATYKDVIWTSSDESIVLVDQTGKVYAIAEGTATITAKTADGGFSKTVAVEIKNATYTVTWVINGETTIESYQVGDKIIVPKVPEITGYTFTGWTPELSDEMPAKDVTYTAIYKLGGHTHSYTSTIVKKPTCVDKGMTMYVCSCGDTKTEDTPALGHKDSNKDGYCDVCKTVTDASLINPCKNAKISVATAKIVDYKSIVTIKATATGVPSNYYLAIYVNGKQVAKGTNTEVVYEAGQLTSDINYTVKVIDANGNVQKDASGKDLAKDSKVTVNASFFKKLIAFFKSLFGSLPTVTIKP